MLGGSTGPLFIMPLIGPASSLYPGTRGSNTTWNSFRSDMRKRVVIHRYQHGLCLYGGVQSWFRSGWRMTWSVLTCEEDQKWQGMPGKNGHFGWSVSLRSLSLSPTDWIMQAWMDLRKLEEAELTCQGLMACEVSLTKAGGAWTFSHFSWPNIGVHTRGTKEMASPDSSMGLWGLRESIRESV